MKKLYMVVFALMVLLSITMTGIAIDSVPIGETADGEHFDKDIPEKETNDRDMSALIDSDNCGFLDCKLH